MRLPFVLSTLLSNAFLTRAEPSSYTPLPSPSSFPEGCTDFAIAYPGDTCESFALKHHLTLFQFLAFNPLIGGISSCPQNVAAWSWYCIGPGGGTEKPTAPRTTLITTTIPYSPPSAASTNPPPPPQTTTTQYSPQATDAIPPTTAVSCRINDCFRAFKQAHSGRARSSQSSWCTSVLNANPPITEPSYSNFPGIPAVPALQCPELSMPAAVVVSSYCSCFTQGQMDMSAATEL
ncbi:hypothetical protein BR93DRAFT_970809 [Coniochaeta sp. PMI_546]|nr:hypothetical protein BR93DRAFT_970809 [Coniochaeta sp. PMI_546]